MLYVNVFVTCGLWFPTGYCTRRNRQPCHDTIFPTTPTTKSSTGFSSTQIHIDTTVEADCPLKFTGSTIFIDQEEDQTYLTLGSNSLPFLLQNVTERGLRDFEYLTSVRYILDKSQCQDKLTPGQHSANKASRQGGCCRAEYVLNINLEFKEHHFASPELSGGKFLLFVDASLWNSLQLLVSPLFNSKYQIPNRDIKNTPQRKLLLLFPVACLLGKQFL